VRTPHPVVDGSGGFLHNGVLNLKDISLEIFIGLVEDLEVLLELALCRKQANKGEQW
jgi:hypothetical protein